MAAMSGTPSTITARFLRRARQGHGRLHYHTQRALGADDQLAQVIAGIVLDQAAVEVEQFSGAGHKFEARHPVPGHTVANHLDAAGVGGNIAADLAGAAGGEVHRVEQALLFGKLLQLCGNHPCAAAHSAIDRVEVLDMVEAVQCQHQLTVAGNSPGAESGATA